MTTQSRVMSRSWRRTPIFGITTAESEHDDKRRANRAFRAAERKAAASGEEMPLDLREVSDVWAHAKDGKKWYPQAKNWKRDGR